MPSEVNRAELTVYVMQLACNSAVAESGQLMGNVSIDGVAKEVVFCAV